MVYVGIVVVLCGLCWNFCGFVWRELSNHEPFLCLKLLGVVL